MLTERELRARAEEFCRWATGNSESGVPITDPIYRTVTQGRHDHYNKGGVLYSSCGDLAHALRYHLGVRRRVNRATEPPMGGWRWQGAENVTWVCRPGNPYAVRPSPAHRFACGDVLVVDDGVDDPRRKNNNKTHVIVVLDDRDAIIASADYGQPGGGLRERTTKEWLGYRWVGERRVVSCLPLWEEYGAEAAARQLSEALELSDWEPQDAPPPETSGFPVIDGAEKPYLAGREVELVQRRLQAAGFDCGRVDGVAGAKTTQALVAFAWGELRRV